MTPMRRLLPALAVALLVACRGGNGGTTAPPNPASQSPPASASPSATLPSPSASSIPSGSPTPLSDLRLPADAPPTVDDPAAIARIAAGDLEPLVPPGAVITFAEVRVAPEDPLDQVALAWRRGDDPFAPETGFVVWQRLPEAPVWRAVYAFTDEPRKGVLGIDAVSGELTGDGLDDLLTLEQSGGSGACGRWRVIAPAPGFAMEVFRLDACDTEILLDDGALEIREAVYEPDDPHCCPSAFRYSTLEWEGDAFVETDVRLEETG